MAHTSPGYGITIRVEGRPEFQPVAEITSIISREGAAITALDVAESQIEAVVIDVTCDAIDSAHAERITTALGASPILKVRKVSDRTFLLHLGASSKSNPKSRLKPAMIFPAPTHREWHEFVRQSLRIPPMPAASPSSATRSLSSPMVRRCLDLEISDRPRHCP